MEFSCFYICCPSPQPCRIPAFICKVTSLTEGRLSFIYNNSKKSCKNLSCLFKSVFLEECSMSIDADKVTVFQILIKVFTFLILLWDNYCIFKHHHLQCKIGKDLALIILCKFLLWFYIVWFLYTVHKLQSLHQCLIIFVLTMHWQWLISEDQ